MNSTAVVVGAGIGGLAGAARLAQAGYDVTVFEKTERPGGRTAVVEGQGYRFDAGPSLFLMPQVFAQTYADLGERMEDHLTLRRIDPTYRVHFHDDSHLDLTGDLNYMREQLEAFEPGSFDKYLAFVREGGVMFNESLDKFVGRNFKSPFEFFHPANLPLLFRLKPLARHYDNTGRYFKDRRLRAAFSFQNMYMGLSPFDAPATYTLLQYTELVDGVWFPEGGMYRMIESLEAIAKGLGARFHYDAPVARIDVEGQRAAGVTLESGESVRADVVLANADLPYVYGHLLPDDGTAERLRDKRYTSSTIMFYWGLRGEKTPEIFHHNVFLADHRYRESFEQIFEDLELPDEPSFYIHAPSRTLPEFAPEDGDGLMVLVPTGHMRDNGGEQDWPALQARAKESVLRRLAHMGLTGLEERIVFEETLTPADYKEIWNLEKGAAFGLSHNVMQVGYLRPHNRHRRYRNLYFAGASTHPGTGLPIVLLSAKLATERILEEQGR